MDNEAQILLSDVAAFCRRDGLDKRLVAMLSQCQAVELTDEALVVAAPSRFAISFLIRSRNILERYLEEIAFMPLAFDVVGPDGAVVDADAVTPLPMTAQVPAAEAAALETAAPAAAAPAPVAEAQATPVVATLEPEEAPRAGAAAAIPAVPTPAPAATATQTPATIIPTAPVATAPAATAPVVEAAPATIIPAAPASTTPRQTAPIAAKKDPSTVKVKSTLTPQEYRALVGKQAAAEAATTPASATAAPQAPAPQAEQPTPEDDAAERLSSKFTFDTFVYGDENKHAYHSAQRFAAFADEPGQYNSLFIYGSSGLGKTHLLLAIQNYLAQNKPHIRVKYANSQAYIDDFINEIARQKTEGRAILRSYHDTDVLIIDDIQNIIGKQASIEYFFSLMDEFIRKNKKVVIASDRAPKNLGMDERLTSRFNAGMLCLVSEPGFEMKYTILRRYYDSIAAKKDEPVELNVDASLLGAFAARQGKLTDEQLRHMAEISGNNIRELESFCERCALVSSEREQAGRSLTDEDIEVVANEYFDRDTKVIHVATVQQVVEEYYDVTHEELIGPKRSRDIAFARHVAVYLANSMCDLSSKAIGEQFGGRDHSTVINSLKVVEKKIREDRRVGDDLRQLRSRITARS